VDADRDAAGADDAAAGLALFYGGLVRAKNLLSVMSQVMGVAAVAILVWVGWGYSLAFSDSGAVVGDLAKAGLKGIDGNSGWPLATNGKAIPELLFACFQMSFAAITVALVVGALVERVRFSAMLLFALLYVTIVYAPIAHMVWAADGLIFQTGAIDFAGGTVVHINAGIAGLVGVAFAGRGSVSLKKRCRRTAWRWCWSGPACCGSAGSDSMPDRRWKQMASPPSPCSTPSLRRQPACLAGWGSSAGVPANHHCSAVRREQ
jgi:ammonia channel protein AmtB